MHDSIIDNTDDLVSLVNKLHDVVSLATTDDGTIQKKEIKDLKILNISLECRETINNIVNDLIEIISSNTR